MASNDNHAQQVHHQTAEREMGCGCLCKIVRYMMDDETLGKDEHWLWDITVEMEQEDGQIWVHGVGNYAVSAAIVFATGPHTANP